MATDDELWPFTPQGRIANVMGGTRAFIVRAGPGPRADVEYRKAFTVGVSDAPDVQLSATNGWRQAEKLADGMREAVCASGSKFLRGSGVTYDISAVRLYHDGESKSVQTYARFLALYRSAIEDRMVAKPSTVTHLQWLAHDAFRNQDATVLEPIIIIASFTTMERLFTKAKLHTGQGFRLGPVAGSVSVIDYPVAGSKEWPFIHTLMSDKLSLALAGVWANAAAPMVPSVVGSEDAVAMH